MVGFNPVSLRITISGEVSNICACSSQILVWLRLGKGLLKELKVTRP